MSAWVFLLLGGMDSIVFGPIRWCVWSFRPSSPLRLPHLKFLFVCLFVAAFVSLRARSGQFCCCIYFTYSRYGRALLLHSFYTEQGQDIFAAASPLRTATMVGLCSCIVSTQSKVRAALLLHLLYIQLGQGFVAGSVSHRARSGQLCCCIPLHTATGRALLLHLFHTEQGQGSFVAASPLHTAMAGLRSCIVSTQSKGLTSNRLLATSSQ